MSKTTLPKYSYVILAAQFVLMIACMVLLILDEYRLYAYMISLFIISSAIQYYRLRRARKPLALDYAQIRQKMSEHRNRELALHKPQHIRDEDLEGLREDIKRHRSAKDESQ